MNKKLIKILSVVVAVTVVVSSVSIAYATNNDVKKTSVINTDENTLSEVKDTILEYVEGYQKRHSDPDKQWVVTLNGNQFDLLSVDGATNAFLNIGTKKQLKYVLLEYVECGLSKLLSVFASSVPDPSTMVTEKDYVSKNFYKGTETFLDEAAENAKWSLGYANASLVPDDWQTHNYFLGGYMDPNNDSWNRVESIVDDMKVRVVALDDGSGRGTSIFATIDCIGISNANIRIIRSRLANIAAEKGISLASVNVTSTHAHSCIDTQGLWTDMTSKLFSNLIKSWTGVGELQSGPDNDFMNLLYARVSSAMGAALDDMKPGTLSYAKKQINEEYFQNKNRPSATSLDTSITRLTFVPDDETKRPTIIANMAAHPDVAGLATSDGSGTGRDLCGEYVYYMEEVINQAGYNFIFINGAICGIYMARGITGDGVDTVHRYEESQRYGRELGRVVLALTMTKDEILANDFISNKSVIEKELSEVSDPEKYSVWYEGWTPTTETNVSPLLNIRNAEVKIPVTNSLILAVGKLNLVSYNIVKGTDGKYYVYSEVGYLEIGNNMKVVLAPGEICTDLIYGGDSLTASGSFTGTDFGYPSVNKIFGEGTTAFGLANDALGYIVPDNDYSMAIIESLVDLGDGENHYHELISIGKNTASSIVKAYVEIAKEVGVSK